MSLYCTVVMPAYNEEGCIAQIIGDWMQELTKYFGNQFRILIINDGSKDKTTQILNALIPNNSCLSVHHQINQGHGASLMNGYRLALLSGCEYVFQTDSDNQFDAADFAALWNRRNESRFILGYRQIRHDALHRLIISKIVQYLILLFFTVRIKDSNVPYRLMESHLLAALLPLIPEKTFIPNICLSIAAAQHNQSLLHIPVHHKERKTGTVSIIKWSLVKACLRSLGDLLRFRIHSFLA